jgi:hypothetical protein
VRVAFDAVDYALLHENRFLGVHPRGALGAEHDRVWVRVIGWRAKKKKKG